MKLSSCFLLAAAAATFCSAQSTSFNGNPPVNGTLSVRVFPLPRGTDLDFYSHPSTLPGNSADGRQNGCPVVLTGASLRVKARYVQAGASNPDSGSPSLYLEFRNMSGKGIRTAIIEAQLKFKKSIYDLDSTAFDLYLSLPGAAITNGTSQQTRIIPLHLPASSVSSVILRRVTYTDGSVWAAKSVDSCGTSTSGAQRIVAK